MPTHRIYYEDSYARQFTASVADSTEEGRVLYLDRTAFYPTSGGQPHDLGSINGAQIVDIVDEGDRIAHRLAAPVTAETVEATIEWGRRYDFMQQHSGQHLLSAVFADRFGLETVSVHMGEEISTIELSAPRVGDDVLGQGEVRATEVCWENRPVSSRLLSENEAGTLRKATSRSGLIRVVEIEGVDRSACGGTHVRQTAELAPIVILGTESVRKNTRVSFVCGGRALRTINREHTVLKEVLSRLRVPADRAASEIDRWLERASAAEKRVKDLEKESATRSGKELYEAAWRDAKGMKRALLHRGMNDDARHVAQGFLDAANAESAKAQLLIFSEEPAAALYAVSAASGVDAGAMLKEALANAGGRGGGSAQLAQGTVAGKEALRQVVSVLGFMQD